MTCRHALLTCLALVMSATVLATPSASGAVLSPDELVARFDHPMGSRIRLHEGAPEGARVSAPAVTVEGIDVSGHQRKVDWAAHWTAGRRFAWVKATEGTGYVNPYFAQQYNGSYRRGFLRGAYHFALPDRSGGAAQARFFSANGGGWSGDGRTLPGALDMEYNPYGAPCYGLSKAAMTAWVKSFSDTYKARWGKFPAIYTSTNWWNTCVGGNFGATNPLWLARYSSAPGPLPVSWRFHTVWQYSSSPVDRNRFNGAFGRLLVFARSRD